MGMASDKLARDMPNPPRRVFVARAGAPVARGEFGLPNPWSAVPDWSKGLTSRVPEIIRVASH
jgi:hypothetical protein